MSWIGLHAGIRGEFATAAAMGRSWVRHCKECFAPATTDDGEVMCAACAAAVEPLPYFARRRRYWKAA